MTNAIKISPDQLKFIVLIAPSLGMSVGYDKSGSPIYITFAEFNPLTDSMVAAGINFEYTADGILLDHEIRDHDGEGDMITYDPMVRVKIDDGSVHDQFMLLEFRECFNHYMRSQKSEYETRLAIKNANILGGTALATAFEKYLQTK